jgi:hypothetical protein
MRQAWWGAMGVGLVFEVPPLVGVGAIEVVATAVPFQPACALEGSHVERDAADVRGYGTDVINRSWIVTTVSQAAPAIPSSPWPAPGQAS